MIDLPDSELFFPIREKADALFADGWPDCEALSRTTASVLNENGLPIRFVEDCGNPYEERIYLEGEVQTRNSSWHDLFNALVWMTFPKSKARLNAVHYREILLQKDRVRSRIRDIATLFDESGVIVASSDERLSGLLRNFEWKSLFWKYREKTLESMRFFIFGHGLFEKALSPYTGLTGHGMIFPVDRKFFAMPMSEQLLLLDCAFASRHANIETSRDFSPVPLLGYPGWTEENAAEAYYDNRNYFRNGRTRKPR